MSDDQTDDRTTEDDETPEEPPADEQQAGEADTQEDETEREEIVAEPAGAGEEPPSPAEAEVVERSPVTIAVTAIVVLAVIAIGIYALLNMQRPEARELLQQTVANYQEAEQVHVESAVSYSTSMGEEQNEVDLPTDAWFARPNKMFFETGGDMQQTTAVSDGESLFLEVGMFPGVIKLPAPGDFAEMPLENLSISSGIGIENMQLPDVASLMSGQFSAAALATVEYGVDETNQWLASLEAPEGTWPLTVRSEGGPPVAIWIDRQDRVVRKFATMIDYEAMVAARPEIEEQLEQLPPERQESVKQMETRIEGTETTVELGQQPPEGTFEYTPPEDTEVVEAETIQEGIQKLMASMMGEQGMPGGPPPAEAPDAEAAPEDGPDGE